MIPSNIKKGDDLGIFLPKQLHQELQSSLASKFYGVICNLIGWNSRFGQEIEVQDDGFSLSFSLKISSKTS